MSIEWGITSPKWMWEHLIANSQPIMLKKSILDLADAFEDRDCMSEYEVLDRIVQVAMTGRYKPPEPEQETLLSRELNLSSEGDIQEFMEELNKLLGEDAPDDKSWEDFLKEREQDDEDE